MVLLRTWTVKVIILYYIGSKNLIGPVTYLNMSQHYKYGWNVKIIFVWSLRWYTLYLSPMCGKWSTLSLRLIDLLHTKRIKNSMFLRLRVRGTTILWLLLLLFNIYLWCERSANQEIMETKGWPDQAWRCPHKIIKLISLVTSKTTSSAPLSLKYFKFKGLKQKTYSICSMRMPRGMCCVTCLTTNRWPLPLVLGQNICFLPFYVGSI